MASFSAPPTRLLLREKHGLKYFEGPPSVTPQEGKLPSVLEIDPSLSHGDEGAQRQGPYFSSDGCKLLFVGKLGDPMVVRDVATGRPLCTIDCTDAEHAYFSPKGTFVVSFSSAKRGTEISSPPPNLCIWRVGTNGAAASMEAGFHLKRNTQNSLPVQWTADEQICARVNTNEVRTHYT